MAGFINGRCAILSGLAASFSPVRRLGKGREVVQRFLNTWKTNNTRDLAEIEIINIRPREELEENWSEFFVRQHYAIFDKIEYSLSFRHVRRSCEAFAMATLQQAPWKENNFPKTKSLDEIHRWLQPLLAEEANEQLTGEPCEQIKP